MAVKVLVFPIGRRVTFREWLRRQLEHATALRHRRRAARFRDALLYLSTGSIARAVSAVPTSFRATARTLADDAIKARGAARRRGRRAA